MKASMMARSFRRVDVRAPLEIYLFEKPTGPESDKAACVKEKSKQQLNSEGTKGKAWKNAPMLKNMLQNEKLEKELEPALRSNSCLISVPDWETLDDNEYENLYPESFPGMPDDRIIEVSQDKLHGVRLYKMDFSRFPGVKRFKILNDDRVSVTIMPVGLKKNYKPATFPKF